MASTPSGIEFDFEHMTHEQLVARLRQLRVRALHELDLARRVQGRLIARPQANEHLAVAVEYIPFGGLSGDCVGIHEDDPLNWDVSVFDVSGHGVAAAILASAVSLEYHRLLADWLEPAEVLRRLDRLIAEQFGELGMFLTISLCHFHLDEGVCRYAGGGHPPALLVPAAGGAIRELASQNPVLGMAEAIGETFGQDEVPIGPGDLLVQYTDGVTEAMNADGELFGDQRLADLAASLRGAAAAVVAKRIRRAVEQFSAGKVRDDVAIAVAEVRAGA